MLKTRKHAVVLMNLGGPHHHEGVRDFLYRLFSDPFIMPYNKFVRWGLAHLIAYLRAPKTRSIFNAISPEGASPLYDETCKQAQALEALLQCDVYVAMRYAPPFIEDVVQKVYAAQPDDITLLPLYPQYSLTTTQSALQQWMKAALQHKPILTRWVPYFFDHPLFIKAHAELIQSVYSKACFHGAPRILLSAHGLPVDLVRKGDPYPSQVHAGAYALSQYLGHDVHVCYQSRVGLKKWLTPSLGSAIQEAGAQGIPLVVVPFAFVSEHSETLYELDIEYQKVAQAAGVPFYGRVPTMGVHSTFLQCLTQLVKGES